MNPKKKHPRCMTGKFPHKSKAVALSIINKQIRSRTFIPDKGPLEQRVYKCEECGCWHTGTDLKTDNGERQKDGIKKIIGLIFDMNPIKIKGLNRLNRCRRL